MVKTISYSDTISDILFKLARQKVSGGFSLLRDKMRAFWGHASYFVFSDQLTYGIENERNLSENSHLIAYFVVDQKGIVVRTGWDDEKCRPRELTLTGDLAWEELVKFCSNHDIQPDEICEFIKKKRCDDLEKSIIKKNECYIHPRPKETNIIYPVFFKDPFDAIHWAQERINPLPLLTPRRVNKWWSAEENPYLKSRFILYYDYGQMMRGRDEIYYAIPGEPKKGCSYSESYLGAQIIGDFTVMENDLYAHMENCGTEGADYIIWDEDQLEDFVLAHNFKYGDIRKIFDEESVRINELLIWERIHPTDSRFKRVPRERPSDKYLQEYWYIK